VRLSPDVSLTHACPQVERNIVLTDLSIPLLERTGFTFRVRFLPSQPHVPHEGGCCRCLLLLAHRPTPDGPAYVASRRSPTTSH
jgi:hypothetical protein